jgi:hypothetical protein
MNTAAISQEVPNEHAATVATVTACRPRAPPVTVAVASNTDQDCPHEPADPVRLGQVGEIGVAPALWVTERGGRFNPEENSAWFVAHRDAPNGSRTICGYL